MSDLEREQERARAAGWEQDDDGDWLDSDGAIRVMRHGEDWEWRRGIHHGWRVIPDEATALRLALDADRVPGATEVLVGPSRWKRTVGKVLDADHNRISDSVEWTDENGALWVWLTSDTWWYWADARRGVGHKAATEAEALKFAEFEAQELKRYHGRDRETLADILGVVPWGRHGMDDLLGRVRGANPPIVQDPGGAEYVAAARRSFNAAVRAAELEVQLQARLLCTCDDPLTLEAQPLAPSAGRSTEIRNREATLRRVTAALQVLTDEIATIARRDAADRGEG